MRDFIINIAPVLAWFLAVTEAATAIVCIRNSHKTLNILASAVSVGLAIDAAIIAAGMLIGEGAFLKSISQIRYVLHGMLVPLLIPIAFYTYGIQRKITKQILWTITAGVIVCGIAMGILTVTEPVDFAGILRYGQAALTPVFARTVNLILSFGGVLPLIFVGVVHLAKHKSPYLMLSGLVMFVFSAIAPATGNMDLNFLTTMIGEDLMVFFFGIELIRYKKTQSNSC